MKVWKKLSAVALSLMMVLALCVMASADGEATLSSGGVAAGTSNAAISSTLKISKAINVTGNNALSAVYGPAVVYKYNIVPASVSNITVNDGTNTGPVRAGVSGAVSISNVTFTSETVPLTTGSGTVTKDAIVTVTPANFTNPGIYRYEITEHSDNAGALLAAGVNQTTPDHLYLDVYIKNGTNGFEVYGFVLLDSNVSVSDASNKKSAFTSDSYKTFDVTLTKAVTGDAGDKNHAFSFAIEVNNGTAGGYYTRKGTSDTPTAQTGTSVSTTLANSETFYIYGLNPKATVTYTETNDTIDQYTVTVTDNADTKLIDAQAISALNGTQATSALSVSNYSAITTVPTATNNSAITFTNNLEAISPTGVALRYAPYLAMMGAGIVALPLSLRKKEEEF